MKLTKKMMEEEESILWQVTNSKNFQNGALKAFYYPIHPSRILQSPHTNNDWDLLKNCSKYYSALLERK